MKDSSNEHVQSLIMKKKKKDSRKISLVKHPLV